jgi:hypothetical protein
LGEGLYSLPAIAAVNTGKTPMKTDKRKAKWKG